MLHEQSFHQIEDLKKQADAREKLWKEKKEHEVIAWREKIHREQDHWQHHMQHQMEASKTEHQKEMDNILHNSYLPKCAKTGSSQPKWVGQLLNSKFSLDETHFYPQLSKKSKDALKPHKKVRFQQNGSIHIIEEDEPDFENQKESAKPACKGSGDADISSAAGGESSTRDQCSNEDAVQQAVDHEAEKESEKKDELPPLESSSATEDGDNDSEKLKTQ